MHWNWNNKKRFEKEKQTTNDSFPADINFFPLKLQRKIITNSTHPVSEEEKKVLFGTAPQLRLNIRIHKLRPSVRFAATAKGTKTLQLATFHGRFRCWPKTLEHLRKVWPSHSSALETIEPHSSQTEWGNLDVYSQSERNFLFFGKLVEWKKKIFFFLLFSRKTKLRVRLPVNDQGRNKSARIGGARGEHAWCTGEHAALRASAIGVRAVRRLRKARGHWRWMVRATPLQTRSRCLLREGGSP